MSLATALWRPSFDADTAAEGFPAWRGFPPGVWLEALCLHESSGNPRALHRDGPGWLHCSYGLFQIEGSTALSLLPGLSDPEPLYHPILNRALALRLLSVLGTEYALHDDINPGDWRDDAKTDRVIAAYNGGEWGAGKKDDGTLNDQVYVDAVLAMCAVVTKDRGGEK